MLDISPMVVDECMNKIGFFFFNFFLTINAMSSHVRHYCKLPITTLYLVVSERVEPMWR